MATFIISDTHFNHYNIIRYCHRPFTSVEEMDECIIENWNKVVRKNDTVFHLGDWGFGKPIDYWSCKLNGCIVTIKGGHDRYIEGHSVYKTKVLRLDQKTAFLLIHDPCYTSHWKSWIIHGHKHNSSLERYPFINGLNKTINVSVELIDYTPLNIDYLKEIGFNTIKRMEFINSRAERLNG